MTLLYCCLPSYVDFNICEEGTGAGVYSGLRFRNQDSGNEYPSDLVDPQGKIFMSLDKQPDMKAVLEKMGEEYGVDFTPEQEKKFVTASTFGVPMRSMQKFLDLPTEQQDKLLKNEVFPVTAQIISLNRGYVMLVR